MKKEKILRFCKIFVKRYSSSELTSTSIIIAYYVLLSMFPLFIIVGNLLPLFHVTPELASSYISALVPEVVLPVLEPIIMSLLNDTSGGLLSISSIALLWTSGKGISYMQNGMNRAYGVGVYRGYFVRHLVGFFGILLIVLLIGIFLLFFSFSDLFLAYLEPQVPWAEPLRQVVRTVKWPVTLVFMLCLITIVYIIAPSVRVRIRDALPGAAIAAIGLILLVQLFALYVHFATKLLSSYGALSSFFVLMFWLNFSAMIVVIGAVLNASVQEYRFGKDSMAQNKIDTIIKNRLITRFEDKWNARHPKPTPPPPEAEPETSPPKKGKLAPKQKKSLSQRRRKK